MALQRGFLHVNIDTWLVVLPQIIARIHSNNRAVRELIQSLLVRIGRTHPQVCSDFPQFFFIDFTSSGYYGSSKLLLVHLGESTHLCASIKFWELINSNPVVLTWEVKMLILLQQKSLEIVSSTRIFIWTTGLFAQVIFLVLTLVIVCVFIIIIIFLNLNDAVDLQL